jgi:hypothetical protein
MINAPRGAGFLARDRRNFMRARVLQPGPNAHARTEHAFDGTGT